jgi:rhodanese-related sulfurtransferase
MNYKRPFDSFFMFAPLLLGLVFLMVVRDSNAGPPLVTLEQTRVALEQKTAVLVDIREPSEHATGVAEGARLIPIAQLARFINQFPKNNGQPLYIICHTQSRSSQVVAQLIAAGFTDARYVKGGMNEWTKRGWPTIKP